MGSSAEDFPIAPLPDIEHRPFPALPHRAMHRRVNRRNGLLAAHVAGTAVPRGRRGTPLSVYRATSRGSLTTRQVYDRSPGRAAERAFWLASWFDLRLRGCNPC